MGLVYDSRVQLCRSAVLVLGVVLFSMTALPQAAQKKDGSKTEPKYDETFSGPIVELSVERITVSRSILGKPAEKRSFWIKGDTRIEGKLKVKARVTVGFVTTDDGDIARLIVVRTSTPAPPKK